MRDDFKQKLPSLRDKFKYFYPSMREIGYFPFVLSNIIRIFADDSE